jgi:hypothetical protein
MGISEKLPLINSHNKLVKIIGYAVYGFLAFVVVVFVLAATSPDRPESIDKNVVLRGYTFTLANADGWVTDSTTERADGYRWGSNSGDYGEVAVGMIRSLWIGWEGQVMNNAFYLPDKRCTVAIYVLDKIDPSELTEHPLLKEAAMLSNAYLLKYAFEEKVSEESITFGGRPAYTIKNDDEDMMAMSVDLSPEEVAVIDVNYQNKGFMDDPWISVLEDITISK